MPAVALDSVFSLPLRHLWSHRFPGEQVHAEGMVKGLSRFVGDSANPMLRYLTDPEHPLTSDWPLVFYGPPGTGKSSLAMAIAANVQQLKFESRPLPAPKLELVFVTADDFLRRFRVAVDTDSVSDFRKRLIGGVMIDNLDRLASHTGGQREVCVLLDFLVARNRPFIATCSEAPWAIDEFLPQLVSRLQGGLCLPLNPPGFDARCEIIRDLAVIYDTSISDDAVKLIASRLSVTVPKINHFLAQLAVAESGPGSIDVIGLEKWFSLHSSSDLEKKKKYICKVVAERFSLRPEDLKSGSRKQTVVLARSVAIYLCRELLQLSFQKIGMAFGKRDHSTVLHAYRKIQSIVEIDPQRNPSLCKQIKAFQDAFMDQFSDFGFEPMENLSNVSSLNDS